MRLYVHGAGRSGKAAWPSTNPDGAIFADLGSVRAARDRVRELGDFAPLQPRTLVAHSAGAVPALLAIDARVLPTVDRLVLIEPALYDLARGDAAIENHIETMRTARELADSGDLFGSWAIVKPVMFGSPAEPADWERERGHAEWFAGIELPWGHGVSTRMLAVPTLVVTGAWNAEYEAIAAEVVAAGAVHRHLEGHAHRPHDHPDFERLVVEFEAAGT